MHVILVERMRNMRLVLFAEPEKKLCFPISSKAGNSATLWGPTGHKSPAKYIFILFIEFQQLKILLRKFERTFLGTKSAFLALLHRGRQNTFLKFTIIWKNILFYFWNLLIESVNLVYRTYGVNEDITPWSSKG